MSISSIKEAVGKVLNFVANTHG